MRNLFNRLLPIVLISIFLALTSGCASIQSTQTTYTLKIHTWDVDKLPDKLQQEIRATLPYENTKGAFHQDLSPKFGAMLRKGADTSSEDQCRKIQAGDFTGINDGAWKRDLTPTVFEVTYISGLLEQKTVEVTTTAGIACLTFENPVQAFIRKKGSQGNVLSPTKSQGGVKITLLDFLDTILSIHFFFGEETK